MENINVIINKKTGMVFLDKTILGRDMENLQQQLIFTFEDEFVDGNARLEYEIKGIKHHIPTEKVDDSYIVPIRNVITKEGNINMQLVIVQLEQNEEIPVFKSKVFYLRCEKSINAQTEAPDDYEYWLDIIQEKIAEMDEALIEVNNLNIEAERVVDGVEITITKKDGTTQTEMVYDGSGGGTSDHSLLENLDYENSGHTGFQATISDLETIRTGASLGATAVQDNNYVHTDNNYSNAEKLKLAGLENYDDTEIKQDIDDLGAEIDNLDLNKVPKTRKVNNKTLENDVTLTPSDIGIDLSNYVLKSQISTIDLIGSSGILTQEQIKLIEENDVNVTLNNDGEIFRLANNASDLTYKTYLNFDIADTTLLSGKAIYIQLDKSAINYGRWSKEDVEFPGGNVEIDEETITKNIDDELQVEGIIDGNENTARKIWVGTIAEYNAIETKDDNTLYYITDDYVEYATKSYVDGLIGNINSILDNINGEVI